MMMTTIIIVIVAVVIILIVNTFDLVQRIFVLYRMFRLLIFEYLFIENRVCLFVRLSLASLFASLFVAIFLRGVDEICESLNS